MFDFPSPDNEVHIYVESINPNSKTLLGDFIDSNNFSGFFRIVGQDFPIDGPSMILFKNYIYRKREGSVYSINQMIISRLVQENRINIIYDSLIVRAEVNLEGIEEDIFGSSISHSTLGGRYFSFFYFHFGSGYKESFELPNSGRTKVTVKDVGQGSWIEIDVDNKKTLIFDAGTHYSTKASTVASIYGNQDLLYQTDCPGLIISHWDVDHYHFLKVMKDETIASFKFILCRDLLPSLTSRVIFSKLDRLNQNCITVKADSRKSKIKETPLFPLYDNNRFTIFNSGNSTSRNKNGLSLLIRNTTKSVLLTGDQHYKQFNQYVLPLYLNYKHSHYLIVPHHGGNAGTYSFNLQQKVKKEDAIISVGKNNYGHPFQSYLKNLRSSAFNIRRTDIVGKDIEIEL